MTYLKSFTFLLLVFLIRQNLYGQNNRYNFSHLNTTNGLSDNQVNCILKDQKGFMWFGTISGLSRYDGYKFKVFKHNDKDPHSLGENNVISMNEGPENKLWIFTHSAISVYDPATESFSNYTTDLLVKYKILTNQIKSVKKDAAGNFWFLTDKRGLYCYQPKTGNTFFYNTSAKSAARINSNNVTGIANEGVNNVWLVYDDGVLDKLDLRSNKIVIRYHGIAKANGNKGQSYDITVDNKSNLWIFSNAGPVGAFCYNPLTGSLVHFAKDSPAHRLNSNVINNVVQADDNNIWIGTDHGGINIVDPSTYKVTYVVSKEDDPKSLSGNSVNLYKDNSGIIWIGTFKQGADYYHSGIIQFPLNKHYISDKNSIPFDDVDCFAEDRTGNLWIGTNGGGLIYFDRQAKTFTRYRHDPADPNSLANDVVVRLCIDHENKLWIGMYFGGLDRMENGKFVHYRHNDKNPNSLTDDRVYSILEDSDKNLWVGTFSGGLNIYDRKNDSFSHPRLPLSSEYTSTVYEDRQKNIWIGRDEGVDVIQKGSGRINHYFNEPNNQSSLVANDVNTILQDSRGFIWIGTKDGVSILDPRTNKFFTDSDGFRYPPGNISNILEDSRGQIWLSTNNGLSTIKLVKNGSKYLFSVNNFNELDGLQGRSFNVNAAYKLKNGELVFGGGHGFNLFDPQHINTVKSKKNLVFTDFQLFNKSVVVGDSVNGNVILNRSISETRSLTLDHNQNVFSIEFAACDYFNPEKIHYQYLLEGFDKGWITSPADERRATYTNLDAGDYIFKVRAQNENNITKSSLITLKIKVLPPFWKSPFAYAAYVLLAMGILLYMRRRGIVKLKKEFEQKQEKLETERRVNNERAEAHRMHQLDLMKIKFFTNLSHEFRTPLSLILSPIDHLINTADKNEEKQHLQMIKRNGKRLLNLVNQLLDFRKMEYNELKLHLTKGDIIQFIKDVAASFTDVAGQKQIQYIFESETCSFITNFDHDKIERILFNLLSNSFKFTSAGGHISVILNLTSADVFQTDLKTLEIKVIDTGIGIPAEKHEKVFDRFFQDNIPENLLNQGSGIGLSITKEFTKMHGGSVGIESEPGYGTCITIKIPLCSQSYELVVPVQNQIVLQPVLSKTEDVLGSAKKPVILLVEDDYDLRFYLKDNLKNSFHVIEAANGKEGWQKALALHPKLIVSDISMPEMNGLDLCRKIKADSRTAQIPLILLTALISDADQLAGLDSGANDYIAKPFNFEILLSKINNLLQLQQTFKNTFKKQIDVVANDIVIVSEDEKFIKNAFDCIEKNITNPNFSVEELSRNLNLSRVSLYKKLLTLTGKTPVDCIRTIRLQRAAQLLEKNQLSIANVAYEVGFNNAAYFAKVFREEFNMLPSEYVVEMRNREKEHVVG
ncbi:response regulator [Pedobacter sp. HMF7647]|uniref:histidine kinase n=1 Tax=Hufsiella arboris TaxID=2695275 RepID=A0A7K1YBL7_9SPHI|nr:hybrid sensor histidine kinase/response regulator transcription factor [Hufsiella arboris]MXV51820.1 response regulator [Hufsiella arboris]